MSPVKLSPFFVAALLAVAMPAMARTTPDGRAVARPVATTKQVREPSPAQLAQRERMRSCAATARTQGVSGAPRKEFMRTCLAKR